MKKIQKGVTSVEDRQRETKRFDRVLHDARRSEDVAMIRQKRARETKQKETEILELKRFTTHEMQWSEALCNKERCEKENVDAFRRSMQKEDLQMRRDAAWMLSRALVKSV